MDAVFLWDAVQKSIYAVEIIKISALLLQSSLIDVGANSFGGGGVVKRSHLMEFVTQILQLPLLRQWYTMFTGQNHSQTHINLIIAKPQLGYVLTGYRLLWEHPKQLEITDEPPDVGNQF